MSEHPERSHTRTLYIDTDLRCYCGSLMTYRPAGKYGPFYSCSRYPECDGAIGTHPDGRPLGIVVDRETRRARIDAHEMFDRLWKNAPARRRKAKRTRWYALLRDALNMTRSECHIARFDRAHCEAVIVFARYHLQHRAELVATARRTHPEQSHTRETNAESHDAPCHRDAACEQRST